VKVCKRCHVPKEIAEFSKQAATPDGLRLYCKSCCAKENKIYAKKNRARINSYQKQWLLDNPDKAIHKRDKARKHRDAYKKKHPELGRLYTANRRAMLLKATPPWQTDEDRKLIADLYSSAQVMSVFHETKFHVDHIEPLLGRTSCGLHIPSNLRIIFEKENLSKSNKLIT
jgi:hypothetical protein